MSATNRATVHDSFQDGALNQCSHLDVSRLTRAECAALLGPLLAQLLTADDRVVPTDEPSESVGDKLLNVEQVALALGVSRQWVYRNGRKLGLAVELGKGTLRYSHTAIQRFITEKRVPSASKSHARKQEKMAQPL